MLTQLYLLQKNFLLSVLSLCRVLPCQKEFFYGLEMLLKKTLLHIYEVR